MAEPSQQGTSAAYAKPAQVPLLRLDLAQTLRELVNYHGARPWSDRDITTAADVLALTAEARIATHRRED